MMKKLLILSIVFLNSFNISAQCDIPSSSTTNTGSNMTVMLTPNFINSLPPMSGNDYLVLTTQVGLTVGVIYWIDPNPDQLAQLSFGTNVALGIWADDSTTPEIDGATPNEQLIWQLVVGSDLYNITPSAPINFMANGFVNLDSPPLETTLCLPPVYGCMDALAVNYDPDATFNSGCVTSCTDCACEEVIQEYVELEPTGYNISILLLSTFIESLPPFITTNSYIIATGSESGQIAGTALLGLEFSDGNQSYIAIWADDGLGYNIGLVGGESIIFTYYDGPNVYNVDLMYSMDGTGDLISSITDPLIFISYGILTANGSHFHQTCLIYACTDEMACNYNSFVIYDDGSCIYPGCWDELYMEYDSTSGCNNQDMCLVTWEQAFLITEDSIGSLNSDINMLDSLIENLYNQLEECSEDLNYWSSPIEIDLLNGWNIIGYTFPEPQDVVATVVEIDDIIQIIKNNAAEVYWPEYGFNGIGDFIPGQGYQIKVTEAYLGFTYPNVEGQRIELVPTVPQWAIDMEAQIHPNDIRTLVRVVNMLGQEVNPENQPSGTVLLYLYNDATVEKKIK